MFEQLTCLLCGNADRDVERSLVRWTEPDPEGNHYSMTNRCKNRVECARRVEANGDVWPVKDGAAL
jgi:hypothetical protein